MDSYIGDRINRGILQGAYPYRPASHPLGGAEIRINFPDAATDVPPGRDGPKSMSEKARSVRVHTGVPAQQGWLYSQLTTFLEVQRGPQQRILPPV